jgi:hypothetical protein
LAGNPTQGTAAVGITQFKSNQPPRLASLAPLMREIRLFGQFLSGRMIAPMIDLVARSLRQ